MRPLPDTKRRKRETGTGKDLVARVKAIATGMTCLRERELRGYLYRKHHWLWRGRSRTILSMRSLSPFSYSVA